MLTRHQVPAAAASPQDVCIFCATRLQFASARTPSRPQRRSFAGTEPARKPPLGATAAQQKEGAGDGVWAAWTPPREVFQGHSSQKTVPTPGNSPEAKGLTGEREPLSSSKQQTQTPAPASAPAQAQAHRPSFLMRKHGVREVEGRRERRELESSNQQAQGLASGSGFRIRRQESTDRFRSEKDTHDATAIGAGNNTWQGLRRKPLFAMKPQSVADEAGPSTPHLNGEQERIRRSDASKSDDYVRLDGLQRRRRRGAVGGAGGLQQTSTTGVSKTEQPLNSRNSGVGEDTTSRNDWARYESQAVQKGSRGDNKTTAGIDYNGWTDATSSIAAASSTKVESSSSQNIDSGSRTEASLQEPASKIRYRNSRTPKFEREEEIVTPRAFGRTIGPNNNRRKERKRYTPSRDAEESLYLDEDEVSARKAARKLKSQRAKEREMRNAPPTPIYLPEFISVSNLARVLKIRVEQFLQKTEDLGFEGLTNDHILDAETAGLIASEYNFEPIVDQSEDQDLRAQLPVEDKSTIPARPPIVTIMGHVDHGKTTLLDFLRKSSVAASEHGGITQHIGAFSVAMSGGRLVTFLDTPGHAAFLSMRQRGAHVTDIVILVVAADDSVKPQTIEAIKHAQSAQVPIIVAVNKMDKEDARPEQVKQDLARYGVEIEDFGGETQVVCVSGKTGQGMAELEDATVALADILDSRAPANGLMEGWVLEATTRKAGRVATVLVRRGTLRPGDVIVAGSSWARVRSLRNEAGVMVDSAGPGAPVSVDGWREQPAAGDEVLQSPANDEQKAKSVVAYRLEAFQREQLAKDMTAVNEARRVEQEKREALERAKQLAAEATTDTDQTSPSNDTDATTQEAKAAEQNPTETAPKINEVFFILKADVSGSVEAVASSVVSLGSSEIRAHILRSGVGPITEFDIDHAAAAKGHIINFNTPVDGAMARLAEERGVRVLDQSIIYRLIDQVKGVLEERLPLVITKRVLGEAEIAQVFDLNVKGRVRVPIAGCRVRNGEITKKNPIRILRGGDVVFEGMSFIPLRHSLPLPFILHMFCGLNEFSHSKNGPPEPREWSMCPLARRAID